MCVRCMHIDSFDDESKRGVRIDQYLLEKGGGYDKIKKYGGKIMEEFQRRERFIGDSGNERRKGTLHQDIELLYVLEGNRVIYRWTENCYV